MTIPGFFLAAFVALGIAGCASEVRRDQGAGPPSAVLGDPKVASVKVYLNDDAQKLLADNIKFNPDALRGMLQRTLEARQLIVTESPNRLEVEITDLRVRSNVAAVLFGFMAGSDLVKGNVYVIGKEGKPLTKFEVSASYALGGLAGGQDETRTSWLYEEFAKLTVNELIGENKK
jgi:hypothetical protein